MERLLEWGLYLFLITVPTALIFAGTGPDPKDFAFSIGGASLFGGIILHLADCLKRTNKELEQTRKSNSGDV